MAPRSAVLITLGIFVGLVAAYAASPIRTSYDSRWSIHTAMSLIEGRGGDLSEYRPALERHAFYAIEYPDGRPRTLFPIGTSLLAAPMVAIVALADPAFKERLQQHVPDHLEKILASILGATAVTIFFWIMFGEFQSRAVASAMTFIFAFGTSMWSTATRALWQHGPLILMLVIVMLLLQRTRHRPALIQYASLPLAMAYIIRPTALIPVVAVSVYVSLYHRRWLLRYALWAMLIAIPWLAFNHAIYGAMLPPYYRPQRLFNLTWFLDALAGHLISPARGVFVFSPVLLFAFSGFALAMRDSRQRPLHLTYAAIVVGHYLTISLAPDWWAGHSFGPRYVSDIIPFLVYFTAFNCRLPVECGRAARTAMLSAMLITGGASVAMHAQGALRWPPLHWNVIPQDINTKPSRLWDWTDPPFLRTKASMPQR
jgi:hypothetical protein